MSEKYGIIGYGFVGKATELSLLDSYSVKVHDIALNTELESLENCDCVFVCIPTATDDDITTLVSVLRDLRHVNPACTIVLRSTVPVGMCRRIQHFLDISILYVPEFLRERSWQDDCVNSTIVVGADSEVLPECFDKSRVKFCSLEEAEILKMFNNNISAMKVVFANHFYDLCNSADASYDTVLSLHDATVHNQSYLEVSDNLRGFGGKCLTKDLDFLINTFSDYDLDQQLFSAMRDDNKKWPTTVRKS